MCLVNLALPCRARGNGDKSDWRLMSQGWGRGIIRFLSLIQCISLVNSQGIKNNKQ